LPPQAEAATRYQRAIDNWIWERAETAKAIAARTDFAYRVAADRFIEGGCPPKPETRHDPGGSRRPQPARGRADELRGVGALPALDGHVAQQRQGVRLSRRPRFTITMRPLGTPSTKSSQRPTNEDSRAAIQPRRSPPAARGPAHHDRVPPLAPRRGAAGCFRAVRVRSA
jgi:hypothetical protein